MITRAARVLQYLREHGTIAAGQAQALGIRELSEAIRQLERAGYVIETEGASNQRRYRLHELHPALKRWLYGRAA